MLELLLPSPKIAKIISKTLDKNPSLSPKFHKNSTTMAWRGSLSRSLISTARASAFRSSLPLSAPTRLLPSPIVAPRLRPARLSFSNPRTLGELGCAQSLLPLSSMAGVQLTSHLALNVRAFCELSHGTFRRSCQDR